MEFVAAERSGLHSSTCSHNFNIKRNPLFRGKVREREREKRCTVGHESEIGGEESKVQKSVGGNENLW